MRSRPIGWCLLQNRSKVLDMYSQGWNISILTKHKEDHWLSFFFLFFFVVRSILTVYADCANANTIFFTRQSSLLPHFARPHWYRPKFMLPLAHINPIQNDAQTPKRQNDARSA